MKTKHKQWAIITASTLGLAGFLSAADLGSEKYAYDESGNMIEKSIGGIITKMNYDKANRISHRQIIGKNKETNLYDAVGRPISENSENEQSIRSLNYGYGDKVVEVQNSKLKTELFYNAEGQLVGKKTNDRIFSYTWDGNVLAADENLEFTNEAHPTGGVPLIEGGQRVVLSDYLGNTLSQGRKQLVSTSYGEGLEAGRLTGKPFVKELNAYLFNYRHYRADISRWTTQDPLGFPDGINGYAYAFDPTQSIDPMGTKTAKLYHNGVKTAAYTYDLINKDWGMGCYHKLAPNSGSGAEFDYNLVVATNTQLSGLIKGYGKFATVQAPSFWVNPSLDIWVDAISNKIKCSSGGVNSGSNGPADAKMNFTISGEDTDALEVKVSEQLRVNPGTLNVGGTAGPSNWAQVTGNYTFSTTGSYTNGDLSEYTWKEK